MLHRFIQHFRNRVLYDNRGFLQSLIGPAIGLGSSLLGGALSKKKSNKPEFATAPEYPEAEGARELWWNKLQDFGGQPGYGAISPDWGDIWQMAQRRVQEYFGGSATKTGARDRIKASAARRGVSETPSMEASLAASGAEEGNIIADLATNQATQQAQFAETGRQNWLRGVQGLAGMKPTSRSYVPEEDNGIGGLIAGAGGAIGNAFTANSQNNWIKNLIKGMSGSTGGPNITQYGVSVPSTYRPRY